MDVIKRACVFVTSKCSTWKCVVGLVKDYEIGRDRLLYRLLLDVSIGVLLFYLYNTLIVIDESELSLYLVNWLTDLSSWLQELIDWLMGNPAGLKLNAPLNQTVGHFFLYHIHLWRTYIYFIGPSLPTVLLVVRYSTLFGFSAFLSVVNDLVALLSIHIYCFHVYAARLYQLQMTALICFWRLFRGKKWNPLRKRIDSVEFDSAQLFLGTLLFTVFLFLLPTVMVYYFVFTALRACIVLSDKLITMLASIPRYILNWLIESHDYKGSLQETGKPITVTDVLEFCKNLCFGVLI